MAVIDGPVGKPVQNIPIPAPTIERESRFDKAKRTFGNNLKEQLKPETIAARGAGALIGGLLGGPMGSRAGMMLGPQIAKRLNGNRQQGLFGGAFNRSNQPLNTFQSAGSNSSNRMTNAMYGPRGSSNTASNGSQAISLGNGQYKYYSPKADKWSIKGSPNVNKSAPVGNNIFSSIFGGSKKD
jgi:gas vesicle protein